MVKTYTSNNGYTGKMYGESTVEIYDSNNKLVYKSGRRDFNTYTGLVNFTNSYKGGKHGVSAQEK